MSHPRTVLVGQRDHDRLGALLSKVDTPESDMLFDELDGATIVPDHLLPGDVVTMGSRITFRDLDTESETTVQLVYPHEMDGSGSRVSILAPVGAALIGLRVEETIEWPLPNGGRRRLKVLAVGAP